jgi:hypothetical protein
VCFTRYLCPEMSRIIHQVEEWTCFQCSRGNSMSVYLKSTIVFIKNQLPDIMEMV